MLNRADLHRLAQRWLPPLAGVGLIVLFLSLAHWQLRRAAEKEALAALFDDSAAAVPFHSGMDVTLYQSLRAHGRYLGDRQVVIDNFVRRGQLGYLVITPLEVGPDEPLLLVDRGWVARQNGASPVPALGVDERERDVSGRAGRLPRVALRPDVAIEPGQNWPKVAVYPQLADMAAALGRPVATTVLLLDASEDDGFLRDWKPEQKGPMMHYGYAFQWSAMALAVLVILIWQTRKRYRHD